jgi:hypothetical protein
MSLAVVYGIKRWYSGPDLTSIDRSDLEIRSGDDRGGRQNYD